jgi:L-cysteine:1D-myo-inositol 2-amino-2-deoxy-alpha-D-glucopyranoside ligase
MIGLDGEKMSKSKGNLVFVSKLIAAGRDPLAIRWALMKSHYRSDRMWTEQLLVESESEIAALRSVLKNGAAISASELVQSIVNALADDLDTTTILNSINSWVNSSKNEGSHQDLSELITALDALLGLKF